MSSLYIPYINYWTRYAMSATLAFRLPLLLFLSLFCATAAFAESALTAEQIAARLQEKYDQSRTVRATFEQKTDLSVGRGKSRYGSGSIMISKPGRMRWDYEAPDRQVLVCDGKTLSIYTEKSNQMIVGPAERYLESDVTFAFFTGKGNITSNFNVAPPTEGAMTTEKRHRLRLTPKKEHPHVEEMTVEIDPETFLVTRLEITDKFGSLTEFSFFKHQVNTDLPASLFSFTPPAGTEIINQP